jgi:excisionase family DNA binding protein
VILTPSEIAKQLKLNLLTIYKYIRGCELKAMQFGRSYRVSEENLEKFLDNKKLHK